MGGEPVSNPCSGAKGGKPEKIQVSQKMMATNDHALSWDGKQIAVTGLVTPISGKSARLPIFTTRFSS